MEWLEQRLGQYRDATRQRETVKLVAVEMYDELWKAVVEIVTSNSLRGIGDLEYNGSPLNHTVTLKARKVIIRLDQDKCGITAVMPDSPVLEFKLRFCEGNRGGSVCLKHNGSDVDYAGAARLIMEPFLFEGTSELAVSPLQ